MSTAISFSEADVARIAPDTSALSAGRDLVRKKKFTSLGISEDGTWLLGKCQGSGKEPYQVSVDFADSMNPTCRCSCPSRKFPCKHGLGLILAYLQDSSKFKPQEPSEDLLAKRTKKAERAEKKAEAAPRKVNTAALAKKTAAQREGLDLLEKMIVDLVSAGEWSERSRLDKLSRQAMQLGDAYLPAAMHVVNQLVVVGQDRSLTEDERAAWGADLIGQLWSTVQKGRSYLDDKLTSDETQAEADAVMENVLGKAWQLTELKEKGYTRTNMTLLELAYERFDDEARQQRIEIGHLVDMKEGNIFQAITFRPYKAMKFISEQPSYTQVLNVSEAAVYPGFINRRVRWEKGAEMGEKVSPAHLEHVYKHAREELKPVLDEFRQQLKHPLAPREAVVLFRVTQVGRAGERVVLVDRAGTRIEAVDRRREYSNVDNLVRAAGMMIATEAAVLVKLFLQPATNTILAEPLAMLNGKDHLRLGL
jgi:hypothetical protein